MTTGISCPRCSHAISRTIETRKKGNAIRRRRECFKCGCWFFTVETIEASQPVKERA